MPLTMNSGLRPKKGRLGLESLKNRWIDFWRIKQRFLVSAWRHSEKILVFFFGFGMSIVDTTPYTTYVANFRKRGQFSYNGVQGGVFLKFCYLTFSLLTYEYKSQKFH